MLYKAYLLDIEGTTTPVNFVYQTLFPLARRALPEFVHNSLLDPGAAAVLYGDARLLVEEYETELASGGNPPPWEDRPAPAGMLPYLQWLMEHDRKSRGLKSIQGRIWEAGYRSGALFGEIYPDVEPAIPPLGAATGRRSISFRPAVSWRKSSCLLTCRVAT